MSTTTISVKKARNSNLELYRIIVMLAIVAHHYVVNSGLMPLMDAEPLASNSIFLYIIGMWGKTGINCFVLITGYFMCKSEITLRKFLKLLLEIMFYNFAINLCFVIFGYGDMSLSEFFLRMLPVKDITDRFVSCYIVFYLFIPFLNILVRNMTKRQHLLLLCLTIGIYTVLSIIPTVNVTKNYVTWFCVLFIIGSYLRLYPVKESDTIYWLKAFIFSVALAISSVLVLLYLTKYGIHYSAYALVVDSNAPLAVFVSICAFMYFKNIKIRQSKLINTIGGGTFGVLLIHANSNTMRQWLWRDIFNNVGHYSSDDIYIHAICVPVIVFIVCSIIEYIRMKIIETPLLSFTYNTIRKYFPNAK